MITKRRERDKEEENLFNSLSQRKEKRNNTSFGSNWNNIAEIINKERENEKTTSSYTIINNWENHETCWISKEKQGSKQWSDLRVGAITMSGISTYLKRSPYGNDLTNDDIAKIICGIHERSYTAESQYNMEIGTSCEPILREYIKKFFKSPLYNIREVGLGVWKKDIRFRGSLDGIITYDGKDTDECIELKIPRRMYKFLLSHTDNKEKRNFFNYKHIFPSHYDQMQGNMVIHGKKFCYYIVYAYEDNLLYIEKVPLNEDHFYKVLYPKAVELYEKYVDPMIKLKGIERIDPH